MKDRVITLIVYLFIHFILHHRTVTALVRKDPSVINDEDYKSNTPLHLAATKGHLKCCKALLENGADVEAR